MGLSRDPPPHSKQHRPAQRRSNTREWVVQVQQIHCVLLTNPDLFYSETSAPLTDPEIRRALPQPSASQEARPVEV